MARQPDSRPPFSRAFTLVETFVVIAILGLAGAIALSAMWGVRATATEQAELVHMRELGALLLGYASAHDDGFPYYGIPGTNRTTLTHPETGEPWYDDWYWGQPRYWAAWLWTEGEREFARMALTGPHSHYELDRRQFSDRSGSHDLPSYHTNYFLTYTAFANPSFWRESDPQRSEDHQPQRWRTIVHPSKKGILLRRSPVQRPAPDRVIWEPDSRLLVWFADGHAALHHRRRLRDGVSLRTWFANGYPVLTTEDGLRGRDVH